MMYILIIKLLPLLYLNLLLLFPYHHSVSLSLSLIQWEQPLYLVAKSFNLGLS